MEIMDADGRLRLKQRENFDFCVRNYNENLMLIDMYIEDGQPRADDELYGLRELLFEVQDLNDEYGLGETELCHELERRYDALVEKWMDMQEKGDRIKSLFAPQVSWQPIEVRYSNETSL